MLSCARKSDAVSAATLPENLAQCHEIIREKDALLFEKQELIQSLESDLKLSSEQIDFLKRKLFGRRSEKMETAPGQVDVVR